MQVLVPALVGLVLIVGFVLHALRTRHPLIQLTLFRNRDLSVAVITMTLFAIAFMGSMLLIPGYFLQVREQTTLNAGLLLAQQGIGAMCTMPLAGRLTDKTGPIKVVLAGIVLVAAGLGVFTQVSTGSSYIPLLAALFVMGLGVG